MRFYDRVEELQVLEDVLQRSRDHAEFTLLSGRRRVGKTMLVLNAYQSEPYLYLFVSRKSESLLCAEYQQAAAEVLGLTVFGEISSFKDFFEQLLRYAEQQHLTLIIDEFQDFERVNKAIFSEIQDVWDRYRDKSRINLIVSGSLYSLLIRIFENKKEPLFGRLTAKMILRPFATRTMKDVLYDHNPSYEPEDLLCCYLLTGGVPKYLSLLMDGGAVTKNRMLKFVCGAGSPFLTEGKEMLVSEFGKDYSVYFSIMQLIASGKTTQAEIDSIIGKNTGAYLRNLEEGYLLISKSQPLFSKPGSRNARWKIRDCYLRFWFRFMYANQSLLETGRHDLLEELVRRHYTDYSGPLLEEYFKTKYSEEHRFTRVGAYWDRKGENEIDLIALNDLDKVAVIAEVKRNKSKISLERLRAKTEGIRTELTNYQINYEALSMENM